MEEKKVTSIDELKKACGGEVVELPSFANGMEFNARLKRPSMLSMVRCKKIPNELLIEANKLFTGGVPSVANSNQLNENMLDELLSIMEVICEEAFVEPTYKELKNNGIELTDEQFMFVFTYTQRGVDGLKSFREK